MVTLAQRREAIAHLETAHQMSERRVCRIIGVDRTSIRYRATKPDDGELRARIRALAHERRRFGYRRLYVLLRREGRLVNRKRVQRIYQEERLMVRRRGGRKRALGLRAPMAAPDRPNDSWQDVRLPSATQRVAGILKVDAVERRGEPVRVDRKSVV